MESVCGSVLNYLQTGSVLADGETPNQKKSMILWHLITGCT